MSYNIKQKLQDNIDAVRTMFRLIEEYRISEPAEREVLRKYSGFDGIKCILNYTKGSSDILAKIFTKMMDRYEHYANREDCVAQLEDLDY